MLRKNHEEHHYISHDLSKLLCLILSHIQERAEATCVPNTKLFAHREVVDVLNAPVRYVNRLTGEGRIATRTENNFTMGEARSLFAYERKRDNEFDEVSRELINLTTEHR